MNFTAVPQQNQEELKRLLAELMNQIQQSDVDKKDKEDAIQNLRCVGSELTRTEPRADRLTTYLTWTKDSVASVKGLVELVAKFTALMRSIGLL